MALIEREAAKAKVAETILGASEFAEDMRQACYNAIDAVLAIDASPVVHGQVLNNGNPICGPCSACGESVNRRARYCSMCGARMDGGEGHEAW